jgi:protein-disulfide isomerase
MKQASRRALFPCGGWGLASRRLLSLALAVLGAMPLGAVGSATAQPAPAVDDLHTLIRSADLDGLRRAAAVGADIDARDAWGRTPLIVALQQRQAAAVALLIELGAGVALTDAWGRTPLLVATQLKNTPAVRLLLARGADVDRANKNDITPLIAAAQTGNLDAMTLLLAARAALDRTDNLGWTALMWAASRNDGSAVKLLVDKGAAVGTVGRDGATAQALACARGADPELLDLLVSGASATPVVPPRVAETWPAPPGKPAAAASLRQPAMDPDRLVRGRPDAPVTIVEYTDFQCPYCAAGAKAVEEVLARYEGQARLVVKHQPLAFHPMARPAAEFFEALALQGPARAWAFYDRLFAQPALLAGGEPALLKLAGELGADLGRLVQDRSGPTVRARLASDLQEVQRFGFDGVPAFIVNGRVIEGAQPAQAFVDVIEPMLRP